MDSVGGVNVTILNRYVDSADIRVSYQKERSSPLPQNGIIFPFHLTRLYIPLAVFLRYQKYMYGNLSLLEYK